MYYTILKDFKFPFREFKAFDILGECNTEDGFFTETLTVNGVTGTTYFEEIKSKLSEKGLEKIRHSIERNSREHQKTK